MTETKIPLGTRLGSMITDHFIMSIIMTVFLAPMLINNITTKTEIKTINGSPMVETSSPFTYLVILGFTLYFCKDIFSGRSIAKRLLKLQIVSNSSNEIATPTQCVIRNFFCIIWPVEVIFILVNPARRLGDMVAGTKVIPFNNPGIHKIDIVKIIISILLAFGMTFLVFYVISLANTQRLPTT